MKHLFSILALLGTIYFGLFSNQAHAQNIISVAFNKGAIGTRGNNAQDLTNLTNFQTLLVSKAYFIQNSSVSIFQVQGNDISGTLRLVTNTNRFVDIPGSMVWNDNGNASSREYMGFIPSPNLVSFNLSSFGGLNYTIDNTRNFVLGFVNKNPTFTNGNSVGGNASSPLTALNDYLATFNGARPAGPVTVAQLTTASTNPILTGSATLGSGQTLSIELNGVVYTTGITYPTATTWSWTVPNNVTLTAGTYNVVATITNAQGYTLSDTSTGELTITSTNFAGLGCVTIVASGGAAENSTWSYVNNVITPNSATAVSINASEIESKLTLGNLTIASPCITINADVTGGNHTNALILDSYKIVQNAGVDVVTQGGNITYTVNGAPWTSGDDIGILLSGTSGSKATINATGGNIVFNASFAATGTNNATSSNFDLAIRTTHGEIRTQGSGTITMDGDIFNNGSSTGAYIWGLDLQGGTLIRTVNGAISITGKGGKTLTNSRGIASNGTDLNVLSNTGAITFNDLLPTGNAGYTGMYFGPGTANSIKFGADGTLVTSSSSPINFFGDRISFDLRQSQISTSGAVTFAPLATSFGSAFSTTNLNLSSTVSELVLGKAGNTAEITLGSATTITGPVSVYGGNITVDGNINTTAGNANGDILLKGTGNITQNASRTITTNGGDVVFWSDSDVNSNGAITLGDNSTINTTNGSTISGLTGGGNIVLAGGADDGTNGGTASDGYPDGFAFNPSGNGIKLGTTTAANTLTYSGGGDIVLRGRSSRTGGSGNDVVNNIGFFQYGKWIANSGRGAITISGTAAGFYGINFVEPATNATTGDKHLVLISDKASGDAIRITGTSTNDYGVVFNYNNPKEILATGGGNISITGTAGANFGIFLQNQDILATSGTITLDGGTRGIRTTNNGARFGSRIGTQITSSTANVDLRGNVITLDALASGFFTSVLSTGTLTLQSSGASFSSDVTLPSPNLTLGAGISGLTVGKSSNTAGITLGSATTIAGPVSVFGGNITVDGNINTAAGNANGDILLKATGNITQNASRTMTTNGGDVTLWSDSDATGTATTAGGTIALLNASSITSNGGNITLGGGADANSDGIPDGYAIGAYTMTARGASNATAGLSLDNAILTAGAGNVFLRGQGTGNAQNFQIGTRLYGGSITGRDISVNAIGSIQGPSSSSWGLSLEGFSIEGSGNIALTGKGGRAGSINNDVNQAGVEIRAALDNAADHSQVRATGTGTIVMNGQGGSGSLTSDINGNFNSAGIRIQGSQSAPLISASGNITLNGTSGFSGRGPGVFINSPISSTSGNVILKGLQSVEGTTNLNGNIEINGTITTSGSITLESPGAVTQTAAITAANLGLVGAGTFTLANTGNNVATVAGGTNAARLGNLSLTDASGGLTIGTVGSTNGLTTSGTITVETLAGDLTLAQNVSTTNTTANAIVLNAGKSTAIGTTTGGNILVTGTPTLTTGTGGIVKLFSGSDAGSTGLTALAGGTANRRDGVDETTSTFSPALAAGNAYALYRQAVQLVAPNITSFTPTTAGTGESVVITGTGFTGVSIVRFGATNAASFVVNSDTQITAVVGTGSTGSVYVQNSAGNDSEAGFVYKVVELKFEGNALDQTDANRDATVLGSATYGPGASGQAICFANTNTTNATTVSNYLKIPDDIIRNRSTFTISLRFKTSSSGAILGYQNLAVGTTPTNWVPILYVRSDGKLSANLWQGSILNVTSANRVDDNNWHKVEFSVTPGSITIYLDNLAVGTSSGTINHLDMSFNQLGASFNRSWPGVTADWLGFTGCIDEFLIVDQALTASQIQQVTALPQPTITSFAPTTAKSGETVTITGTNLSGTSAVKLGGVAARSFTIVSATEIRAIVGKDATLSTDVEVTSAAGTVTGSTFTFDCGNNSLAFDGSNDHVSLPNLTTGLSSFTFEAWVKPTTVTNWQRVFDFGTGDTNYMFLTTQSNAGTPRFGIKRTTSSEVAVSSSVAITAAKWAHLAVTLDAVADQAKIYVNGVLTGTASITLSPADLGTMTSHFLGRSLFSADPYFNGLLDEVKLWSSVRTAQQILAGMNAELIGNESGLVAYYNFNQGTPAGSNTGLTILNNLTASSSLNGTLTNFALSGSSSNFVGGILPVITTQPASSSSVCAGSGSLTVSAVGSQLTYQWYSNTTASTTGGTAISGATTATLTIPSTATGTNYYYVVVSGACSQSVTSTVSTVTVTPAPAAPVADAAQLFCGSAPTLYKFARIVFSDVKSFGSANSIQVSEWRWMTGNTVISQSGTTVTNPGGSNPSGEGPQNIYDGNTSSKWLDFNIKSGNNTSTLQFAFPGQGFEITGYSWTTANDSEERDPRSWKVFMSVDGTNWTEVDSRTGIAAPSGRFTSAGSWSYATPVGGWNVGGLTATALAGHTLRWYTVATGGTGTSTAPAINANNPGVFTYYVAQVSAGGCESPRTAITATVAPIPSAPTVSNVSYCIGGTATALTATAATGNTLNWYTAATGGTASSTAPVPSTSATGTTTYYVSQVNATGCESQRAAITVTVSALPDFVYGSSTYSFERTRTISFAAPVSTGATITGYTISPALPAGLTFNTSTGAISGTPTASSASTTYTVTGTTASGCVGTTTFTLEVFSAVAPSALSYSPTSQTVRQGTAITAMTPTVSGGTPTYTISPALPAGLSINATTGVISGTLTATQTGTVTYTITAANSGGSVTATISLIYNTAPTGIALSPASVAENAVSGTTVGTLSATDADAGDTFTFALVSGTGSTDNASFTLDGTSLKTVAVFDFETKASYSVRVRVTDAGGLTFERQLTITVTDVNEDRDGDGVRDNEEVADGTDPLDACSFNIASQNATPSDAWKSADCDNDGLSNQREKELGTDPLKADTDGDGVPDGVEVTDGTDPLDASKYKDTDGDLVPNFVETAEGTDTGDSLKYKDSDMDGVPDYIELRDGTNPNSATSFKDTDGGGVPDYVEMTLFPNLGLAATNPSQRGDDEQDTDGDGVPDYQEVLAGDSPNDASDFLDSDGDGVPDFVERKQGTDPNNSKDAKDSDGDGVPDHVQARSIQLSVLKEIVLAWGTANHLSKLPTTVEVGIYSGEKTNFEVVWNKTETLNILKRGTYELKGTLLLPKGYYNPYLVNGVVRVNVLPKPAPRDVTINNNTFVGSTTQFFIPVGAFVVNDPVDNIHMVSLLGDGYDNKFFEIKNNILFWSSADRAPGKTSFSIVVRVLDRDGNTLDKFFTITRTRPDFSSLTIYNTFTPNGDRFNDTWGVPEVRFYEGARIAVYERGGARVFYTEDPDVRWDGTFNGKEMPVGSYYWVIQIEETGATRRGIVNLLRK